MSIRIIKPGIFDTVQDTGRYGFQHLGVNPGGAMDSFSAQVANLVIGNDMTDAVIEIHFPGPTILFQEQAMISISGADFSASLNGEEIPLAHPVIVSKNCLLQFHKQTHGARAYIAIKQKLLVRKWLNSYGTNVKATAGGFNGRSLKKDDTIGFVVLDNYDKLLGSRDHLVLPWQADVNWQDPFGSEIFVLAGNEWNWLGEAGKSIFLKNPYYISNFSDRMGYMLVGQTMEPEEKKELVSAGVSFGTIQLLPGGQMIILMADHQTTGGYPRIAHVVKAHLSKLSQMQIGEQLRFQLTGMDTAEKLLAMQYDHLQLLQNACKLKLASFLN